MRSWNCVSPSISRHWKGYVEEVNAFHLVTTKWNVCIIAFMNPRIFLSTNTRDMEEGDKKVVRMEIDRAWFTSLIYSSFDWMDRNTPLLRICQLLRCLQIRKTYTSRLIIPEYFSIKWLRDPSSIFATNWVAYTSHIHHHVQFCTTEVVLYSLFNTQNKKSYLHIHCHKTIVTRAVHRGSNPSIFDGPQ